MSPPPRHVLVLSFDTFGDLVLRQPLLGALLDRGTRVTLAVRRGFERIAPHLDPRLDVHAVDLDPHGPAGGDRAERADAVAHALRAHGADCVVAAPFNRSWIEDALLGALADTRRVALRAPSESSLDAAIEAAVVAEDAHELEKAQALFAAVTGEAVALPRPRLLVGDDDRAAARAVRAALALTEPYVLAAAAGTVTTALKAWPAQDFARAAAHLGNAHGLPVLLVGVRREEAHLAAVAASARAAGARCETWIGAPEELGTLLGLVASSRLYVGSDSGPMHFAAALGVPVLARFGGGHWPRFLPAAASAVVVTQRLPCFGCGWTCWLPEPACIRDVADEAVARAIDELLAGREGVRVDEGRPLDPSAAALVAAGAERYRRTELERRAAQGTADALAAQLAASEADRAARLAVIEDAHRRLAEAAADRLTRAAQLAQVERRRREEQERTAEIARHAAYLASADGAIRVLGLAAVHRLGIYEFARRHRPLIDRLLRPFSRPSTEPVPVADTRLPRPELFEALAAANALGSGAHELALERLHALGALLPRVLCLGGTPRALAGAYVMAAGGAEVTLVGAEPPPALRIVGLNGDPRPLGRLLADEPDTVTHAGTLLLDGSVPDEALLAARLDPGTRVLALDPSPELARAPHASDVPGLALFETPPAAWVRGPARPDTLPSGRPWPRISVVTVSYNHAAFLEDTLRSVLDQDYPDLEYIVVDGGSQDGTAEILDRYRDRLAYCVSEPDRGQSHALNKGFARATGDILAWLNSDDRYAPDALWRAALAFDQHGADVVSGGCALAEEPTGRVSRVHRSALPIGRAVPLRAEALLDLDGSWLRGDFFFQPEVFWTRELWRRTGARVAEELHYSMDFELWVRFALAGARIVHVPDTLAVYRVHPGQKTAGEHLPYLPELRRVAASFRPVEA